MYRFLLLSAAVSTLLAQTLTIQFPYENPIYAGDAVWNNSIIGHAMVIPTDVGYHMYSYVNLNGGPYHIVRSASEDGIEWYADPVAPLLAPGYSGDFDELHVIYPSVIELDSQDYQMWYTGRDSSMNLTIGYASSSNGTTWNKYQDNPILAPTPGNWDSQRVSDACVLYMDEQYMMWYTGYSDISHVSIGFATSMDGIEWEKLGEPVFSPTGDSNSFDSDRVFMPFVVHDGQVFHLFYVGTQSDIDDKSFGHAVSADGITWFRDPYGAWITPDIAGPWAASSASSPHAIREENRFRMWFSGLSGGINWSFGYAEVHYTSHLGDVNYDGFLSITDIMKLVNTILGTEYDDGDLIEILGDVNQDNSLDILDIQLIISDLLE